MRHLCRLRIFGCFEVGPSRHGSHTIPRSGLMVDFLIFQLKGFTERMGVESVFTGPVLALYFKLLHPDGCVCVHSVRKGNTDVYRKTHRFQGRNHLRGIRARGRGHLYPDEAIFLEARGVVRHIPFS